MLKENGFKKNDYLWFKWNTCIKSMQYALSGIYITFTVCSGVCIKYTHNFYFVLFRSKSSSTYCTHILPAFCFFFFFSLIIIIKPGSGILYYITVSPTRSNKPRNLYGTVTVYKVMTHFIHSLYTYIIWWWA